MFGSRAPRTVDSVIAQLTKAHGRTLGNDEHFLSVCDGFAPDQPHPEPQTTGGWRRSDSSNMRTASERLSLEGAAHLRLAAVRQALGMLDQEFSELPASSTGYLLAHTETRLFIFDGSGRTYLTEADVSGLWMQPIEHTDCLFTLVFKADEDRVAVATRRESIELTRHFISSFPDRRGQARVLVVAGEPAIAEF